MLRFTEGSGLTRPLARPGKHQPRRTGGCTGKRCRLTLRSKPVLTSRKYDQVTWGDAKFFSTAAIEFENAIDCDAARNNVGR